MSPAKASPKPSRKSVKTGTKSDSIALTLKVDSATFVRLSTLRAKERRTAQDILYDALLEYLARAGA
jgi:hypothetical protein